MYNNITTVCHLVSDPELRTTPSGKSVCTMRVCVSDSKARDKAYIDVELWDKPAEIASEYLKKGREVLVYGSLFMSSWENKEDGKKRNKHYIKASGFKFLGGGKKEDGDKEEVPVGAPAGEEDVPF